MEIIGGVGRFFLGSSSLSQTCLVLRDLSGKSLGLFRDVHSAKATSPEGGQEGLTHESFRGNSKSSGDRQFLCRALTFMLRMKMKRTYVLPLETKELHGEERHAGCNQ